MRQFLTLMTLSVLSALSMMAQLPQFTSIDYEGWVYNNPNVAISMNTIGSGRIVLYVNSVGLALSLTSPEFSCTGMDSIRADVQWFTRYFSDNNFDLNKATFTLVIDDLDGQGLDSVTYVPTTPGVSTHQATVTLAVPAGLEAARLRLVSWTGNVVSSGGVKQALFTPVAGGSSATVIAGDVDGSGAADIADVAILVDYLLSGHQQGLVIEAADVDQDGDATIADVSILIDRLLVGDPQLR